MATCNACGGPKPEDKFRACPDCRAEWREYSRARKSRPAERNGRTIVFPIDLLDRLKPHADRRNITVNVLMRRMADHIADDNLVDSILDDAEGAA